MALSFSQAASLTCPECKTPFTAEIWLTVDAGERTDLAARCHDGSIHLVTCPNGHSGLIAAPLVYHDRAKKQLFLAYPQGMPQEQLQQAGKQLIQQMRAQMLILPGNSYLDAPQAIPYEFLPAAMDDRLDEVMAQLQAQMEQAEALRQDPGAAAALRVLQEHEPLFETIQVWMNIDVWSDSKQFLDAHPELVSDDAELVLTAMLDLARAQNETDAQEDLNLHIDLVRAARADGIDTAFEQYLDPASNAQSLSARAALQARLDELNIHSQQELEHALPDHPELQELMQRVMLDDNPLLSAINELMAARSPQEVIQLASIYPFLVDDDGMDALREIVTNARAQGDTATADHLEQRLATLEQIKSSGLNIDELAKKAALRSAIDPATEAELRTMIEQEEVHNDRELALALEKHPDLRAKLQAAAQRDPNAHAD